MSGYRITFTSQDSGQVTTAQSEKLSHLFHALVLAVENDYGDNCFDEICTLNDLHVAFSDALEKLHAGEPAVAQRGEFSDPEGNYTIEIINQLVTAKKSNELVCTDAMKKELRKIKGVPGMYQDLARNMMVRGCIDQGAYIQFGRDLNLYNLWEAFLCAKGYEDQGHYAQGTTQKAVDMLVSQL